MSYLSLKYSLSYFNLKNIHVNGRHIFSSSHVLFVWMERGETEKGIEGRVVRFFFFFFFFFNEGCGGV